MTLSEKKNEERKKMNATVRKFFLKNDNLTLLKISKEIFSNIISTAEYQSSRAILCFLSSKNEIETDFFIKKTLLDKKILASPRVIEKNEMEFRELLFEKEIEQQTKKGAFGIREPLLSNPLFDPFSFEENMLVIVPGIAFSKDGNRLGHGKGFYDRFLSRLRLAKSNVFVFAPCFPCQIVESVPTDEYDQKIDRIFF